MIGCGLEFLNFSLEHIRYTYNNRTPIQRNLATSTESCSLFFVVLHAMIHPIYSLVVWQRLGGCSCECGGYISFHLWGWQRGLIRSLQEFLTGFLHPGVFFCQLIPLTFPVHSHRHDQLLLHGHSSIFATMSLSDWVKVSKFYFTCESIYFDEYSQRWLLPD